MDAMVAAMMTPAASGESFSASLSYRTPYEWLIATRDGDLSSFYPCKQANGHTRLSEDVRASYGCISLPARTSSLKKEHSTSRGTMASLHEHIS